MVVMYYLLSITIHWTLEETRANLQTALDKSEAGWLPHVRHTGKWQRPGQANLEMIEACESARKDLEKACDPVKSAKKPKKEWS